MDWVLNILFIGIIFAKYYITQTKIYTVKVEKKKTWKSQTGQSMWDGGSIIIYYIYVINEYFNNIVIVKIKIKFNLDGCGKIWAHKKC